MLGQKREREESIEELVLKGFYSIETVLEDNKVLEADNFYLRIKKENYINYNQYFYFQPLEDNSYLIKSGDNVLSAAITQENFYIVHIQEYKYDDSQKWILKRLDNNVYQIMNKSLKKFIEIPGNTQINTLIYLSETLNNINLAEESFKSFFLWPKENQYELHISYPFENVTKKMITRKLNLEYIEIDNSITFEKYYEINFKDCKYLKKIKCCCEHLKYFKNANFIEIIIQEGEVKLKKEAFLPFKNLESITLPQSLIEIEKDTFIHMNKIKNVEGEHKWLKYFNLTLFEIPKGDKIIKREIFYQWKTLRKVILPDSIEEIEEGAFEESGIEEIEIPLKVKIIPHNAFKNCTNLKKVKIHDKVDVISATAFQNCNNLDEKNIFVGGELSKQFLKKKLIIQDEFLDKNDYWQYQSVEELEISLNTKFKSDEIGEIFFGRIPNLIKVKMNPDFFRIKAIDKTKLKEIIIPEGIINIKSEIFKNCISLEYLELPESLISIDEILIGFLNTNLDVFGNCINLKTVKIPEEIIYKSQFLFYNCYNLSIIKHLNGKAEKFRMKHEIEEGVTFINIKDLRKMKNLHTLVIPSTIKDIINDEYDISENLECIIGDPKWLSKFPAYQLKKIIIPSFVKKVNEQDFKDADNLEKIIFEGKISLEGNICKNFEKILNFECHSNIIGASENLKKSEKNIEIDGECETIDGYSFDNWTGLKNIYLFNGLKKIEKYAFFNCTNLFEIEIPDSVEYIDKSSFENCSNLNKIKCNGEFLPLFPNQEVKYICLTEKTEPSHIKYLNNFQNLESLEIPEHITNLDINLPKLNKIKCSSSALGTLHKNSQKNLQSIELYDSLITEEILKNCINAQNYIFPQDCELKKEINKKSHKTSVNDIIKLDKKNKKYEKYLLNMIEDIENEKRGKNNVYNDELENLSNLIIDICITIKKLTNNKIIPHPVQCFSMLRLLDEILNNNNTKGVLAEIQTGEGKSYIIAVVAIALALKGRKVDIVTSTLELAFRDEEEQREFYNYFKISSGVLCSENSDNEYIELYKPNYKNEEIDEKSGFYLHILEYPIIYSTNYNYQFLYLYSLFQADTIRKREYDIVLIDEVDNMLLDQMRNPAIIGNSITYYKYEQILLDLYNLSDSNENYIYKLLNEKYKDISNINIDIIKKCKQSAKTARRFMRDIDYIIENNNVIIMDSNTGYKKPGQRWNNYIHEFCEIKEKCKIEKPLASYCMINQKSYFNIYKKISGVTGTIGDLNDQKILKKNYKIEIFKVPRNIIRPKKIIQKQRPDNRFSLYQEIINEIQLETGKGRPILVIMDSPFHVDEFINMLNAPCGKISGIDLKNDKISVINAGKERQITIATSAGGRGIDIKLTQESIRAGGLHVIIPFCMPNERCENQAFGRSGRQGQPGSATIYRSDNDIYIKTPDFDSVDSILIELQYNFNNYIKTKWPWIYSYSERKIKYDVTYEFNTSTEKVFEDLSDNFIVDLVSFAYNKKEDLIDTIYTSILSSWSFFFNSLKWNEEIDYNMEYEKYLSELRKWIPLNLTLDNCLSFYSNKLKISDVIENINQINKPKNIVKFYMFEKMFYYDPLILEEIRIKAKKLTYELFGINFNATFKFLDEEIPLSPYHSIKITCSRTVSAGETKCFTISHSMTLAPNVKDIFSVKLNVNFHNLFKEDVSPEELKEKMGKIIGEGTVSIEIGFRKLSIIFSSVLKKDNKTYNYSIIFILYLDRKFKPPFAQQVPVPILYGLPVHLRKVASSFIDKVKEIGKETIDFVKDNYSTILISVSICVLIGLAVASPELSPLYSSAFSLVCNAMNSCHVNHLSRTIYA